MYGCSADWGGERLHRSHKKHEITVYHWFVSFIYLDAFHTYLMLYWVCWNIWKIFLKQHWILSQCITCGISVNSICRICSYVLCITDILNISCPLCSQISVSRHCERKKPAVHFQGCLFLMGSDNPPLSGWFCLLIGGKSESALFVSSGEGCHTLQLFS